jgi:hypothetical protein
LVLIP